MKNSWIPNVLREAAANDGGGGAGGAGGTPPADWRAGLPDDIKGDPSIKDIKDVASLTKSYINAQKMVGADKLMAPQKNWSEAQWSDLWNKLGRPEVPDKYAFKVEAPEGVQVDDVKMGEVKKFLHTQGLSDKQAGEVVKYYLNSIGTSQKALTDAAMAKKTSAVTELKSAWGSNFDQNLAVAQSVIKKFGGDEIYAKLAETGLGDDPAFIKLFHQIGTVILDDKAHGGGSGLIVGDAAQAITEIKSLKGDADFTKKLLDREAPGHKEAKEHWESLHKVAYPSK